MNTTNQTCTNCGSIISLSAKFCIKCGTIVSRKPLSENILSEPKISVIPTKNIVVDNNPVELNKSNNLILLGVGFALIVLVLAFQLFSSFQAESTPAIAKHPVPTSGNLQDLAAFCSPQNIYGKDLTYANTKVPPSLKISVEEFCGKAVDIRERIFKDGEKVVNNFCSAVDKEAIKGLGQGSYEAGKKLIEDDAQNGNQESIRISNLMQHCENETSKAAFLNTSFKDITYALYSIGSFSTNGKKCDGYLLNIMSEGTSAYELRGFGECESFDASKNVFHPTNNSSATPAGEYYRDILQYNGDIPVSWSFKGEKYVFAPISEPITYSDKAFDTVAGKFIVKSSSGGGEDIKVFLNDREIENCLDGCSYASKKIVKTFDLHNDKTTLLAEYNTGAFRCGTEYYFFSISKDGSYKKLSGLEDACDELDESSFVQNGSKIIVTKLYSQGNDSWIYENEATSRPFKDLAPSDLKTLNTDVKVNIPLQFQGTWAEPDDCIKLKSGSESDSAAVIDNVLIARYENHCTLAKIIEINGNTLSGNFDCSSEGNTEQETITLSIEPDGKLSGLFSHPLPICK